MAPPHLLFLVGGARSGKSDFAISLGRRAEGSVCFVATASVADDADMAERVERHRADRPDDWDLVEAPIELAAAIDGVDARAAGRRGTPTTLIVDCLTVWTANLMFDGRAEAEVLAATGDVVDRLRRRPGRSIVVSNEVGLGVHPETPLGRSYRDVLGRVNQLAARGADRSLFFAAGRAFELHDPVALLGLGPSGGETGKAGPSSSRPGGPGP